MQLSVLYTYNCYASVTVLTLYNTPDLKNGLQPTDQSNDGRALSCRIDVQGYRTPSTPQKSG